MNEHIKKTIAGLFLGIGFIVPIIAVAVFGVGVDFTLPLRLHQLLVVAISGGFIIPSAFALFPSLNCIKYRWFFFVLSIVHYFVVTTIMAIVRDFYF